MDSDSRTNHSWWEERAHHHARSDHYRKKIHKLRKSEPLMSDLERSLAGDVCGKRLLHLPCHLGVDALSWAQLGATTTGLDFSQNALDVASDLTEELGLSANWVCADVCQIPASLESAFDIVVVSHGSVAWVKDIQAWIEGMARSLVPGGRLIIVDEHPLSISLETEELERGVLRISSPLMGGARIEQIARGSYADRQQNTNHNRRVGWCHGLAELFGAMTVANLRVEHFGEHSWCEWQKSPNMIETSGGYVLPVPWSDSIPLTFSMMAKRLPFVPTQR